MQTSLPGRHPGVTLMELLLVVAVLAVVAPITVPVVSSYMEGSKDLAVTHKMVDLVAHARSMGLMGRNTEATIS
ncbi:MAG TPA: prepilin-type N-terminal cleavage/methylation domain-containing protein, partial [Candidatus Rifleibacterium sp.]|nr:prepilin-type N-terminal cleavage/methylation domain-containing protein [Candidatus Rifleibacterium sp.]